MFMKSDSEVDAILDVCSFPEYHGYNLVPLKSLWVCIKWNPLILTEGDFFFLSQSGHRLRVLPSSVYKDSIKKPCHVTIAVWKPYVRISH